MRSPELAADYVRRAKARLATLDALFAAHSWADVVRESQEVVELALKGLLRGSGIEPPRIHDVSAVLTAEKSRLPRAVQPHVEAARGPPTDWGELVQAHDDRDVFQGRIDELPAIDIHSL
jgi:HEPN domain-containing protein